MKCGKQILLKTIILAAIGLTLSGCGQSADTTYADRYKNADAATKQTMKEKKGDN